MSILLEETEGKQVPQDWNSFRCNEGQEGTKVGAVIGADGLYLDKVTQGPGEWQVRVGWEGTQSMCFREVVAALWS